MVCCRSAQVLSGLRSDLDREAGYSAPKKKLLRAFKAHVVRQQVSGAGGFWTCQPLWVVWCSGGRAVTHERMPRLGGGWGGSAVT